MALMGARDMRCKVAMLNLGLEDTLAYYTVEKIAAGYGWLQEGAGFPDVRHQAEQRLVRRGHLDHQTESWQPLQLVLRAVKHRRRGDGPDEPDSGTLTSQFPSK